MHILAFMMTNIRIKLSKWIIKNAKVHHFIRDYQPGVGFRSPRDEIGEGDSDVGYLKLVTIC